MTPPEPEPAPAPEPQPRAASPPAPEEADLTWEDKEDKLDAENIEPDPPKTTATDKKYQYKEGMCLNFDAVLCPMLAIHSEQLSYLAYTREFRFTAFRFVSLDLWEWHFT